MPSRNGDGGRGGPWASGAKPGSDLEHLIRQGQGRLKEIIPGGGGRRVIVFAVLALVGLGAWTAYYTVPSDSVAVVQRFGKYLKDVPPGLHFKLPMGIDVATILPVIWKGGRDRADAHAARKPTASETQADRPGEPHSGRFERMACAWAR